MARILVADHLAERRSILCTFLRAEEHIIIPVARETEALKSLREMQPDLIILAGTVGFTKVLTEAREANPGSAIIMLMTGPPSAEQVAELMNQGISEVLVTPLDITDVQTKIERTLDRLPSADAVEIRFHDLVGSSRKMQQVFRRLVKAAAADSPVLLVGEPGTGKELIAEHIHRLSSRKDRPFRVARCAGLPPADVESELFGHEPRAFDWAVDPRPGHFELCDGGVIYLDDIFQLSVVLQTKLLRFLEEQILQRFGGSRTLTADVRVLAATSTGLTHRIAEETFRGDLYYRLSSHMIEVPPLRLRAGDIPELVELFLSRYNVLMAGEAMEVLMNYSWPGNVDELKNVIEQLVNLCDGNRIELRNLPPRVLKAVAIGDRKHKYIPAGARQ